jgi:hypothetical protein
MNVPMIDSRPYDWPPRYLVGLVHQLCALPSETEWVEFKVNYTEPQAIGRCIAALANTAAGDLAPALARAQHRFVPVASAARRATGMIHTSGPFRSQAADCDRQVGACYLHACLRYVTRQPMTNDRGISKARLGPRAASMTMLAARRHV